MSPSAATVIAQILNPRPLVLVPATVFACDMSGLTVRQREEHLRTIARLFGAVRRVVELPGGYAFEMESSGELLRDAAAFVDRERLCCPFFGFATRLEARSETFRLHIVGPEGVKPFIRAELGAALPEAVREEAGFPDA